jgi:hypothetical protein
MSVMAAKNTNESESGEAHELGDVVGHAGLEHGDGNPIEHVGELEDLEVMVLEGLLATDWNIGVEEGSALA